MEVREACGIQRLRLHTSTTMPGSRCHCDLHAMQAVSGVFQSGVEPIQQPPRTSAPCGFVRPAVCNLSVSGGVVHQIGQAMAMRGGLVYAQPPVEQIIQIAILWGHVIIDRTQTKSAWQIEAASLTVSIHYCDVLPRHGRTGQVNTYLRSGRRSDKLGPSCDRFAGA